MLNLVRNMFFFCSWCTICLSSTMIEYPHAKVSNDSEEGFTSSGLKEHKKARREVPDFDVEGFLQNPTVIIDSKKYDIYIEPILKRALEDRTDRVIQMLIDEIQRLEKSHLFPEVVSFSFMLDNDHIYVKSYAGENAW